VHFKVANTELHPQISCQVVLGPSGCTEQTLGIVAINIVLGLNVPSTRHLYYCLSSVRGTFIYGLLPVPVSHSVDRPFDSELTQRVIMWT